MRLQVIKNLIIILSFSFCLHITKRSNFLESDLYYKLMGKWVINGSYELRLRWNVGLREKLQDIARLLAPYS